MKLDYLHEGVLDCPIIRLSEYSDAEVNELRNLVLKLSAGALERMNLTSLTDVESNDGSYLSLVRAAADEGVVRLDDSFFECRLTPSRWSDVADLLEPFCTGFRGFQWLDETGNISLLITRSGMW